MVTGRRVFLDFFQVNRDFCNFFNNVNFVRSIDLNDGSWELFQQLTGFVCYLLQYEAGSVAICSRDVYLIMADIDYNLKLCSKPTAYLLSCFHPLRQLPGPHNFKALEPNIALAVKFGP